METDGCDAVAKGDVAGATKGKTGWKRMEISLPGNDHISWVVVWNIFYFHPDPWGNDLIWLYDKKNQVGWNHQLVSHTKAVLKRSFQLPQVGCVLVPWTCYFEKLFWTPGNLPIWKLKEGGMHLLDHNYVLLSYFTNNGGLFYITVITQQWSRPLLLNFSNIRESVVSGSQILRDSGESNSFTLKITCKGHLSDVWR